MARENDTNTETMDGVPKLDIDQYLTPLSINGMNGRMLRLPAPKKKKREILLIYGHHASLERMFGLAQALNRYGAVTTPDLPGFGGMDSFYKIGKKPTIDNLADYLAAFIKMRYKKQKITIGGMSLGFVITTRMLQKYPKMVEMVELNFSAFGFTHKDDLIIASRRKKAFLAKLTRFLSWRVPGLAARAWLRKPIIRHMYKNDNLKAHSDYETEERRQYRLDFEVWLWQNNDIRTHFFTLSQMLTLNLCDHKVALPVYQIAVVADQYLDNHMVEQHMRVIYTDYIHLPIANAKAHAPTIVATAKEAGIFLPPKLRQILNKQS